MEACSIYFRIQFMWLSIIFLRFIYVFVCIGILFLLMAKSYSIVQIYTISWSNYLLFEIWAGTIFPLLWIKLPWTFVWIYIFISLWYIHTYTDTKIWLYGNHMFNFIRKLLKEVIVPFSTPPAVDKTFLSHPQHLVLSVI